jgi:hypothetical protein
MRGSRLFWFILLMILLTGLVIFMFSMSGQTNWQRGYAPKSQAPYGLSIFHSLLNQNRQNTEVHFLEKKLAQALDTVTQPAMYLFTGEELRLTQGEATALADFMRQGHTVMLNLESMPLFLLMAALESDPNQAFHFWNATQIYDLPDSVYEAYYHDSELAKQQAVSDFRKNYRDSISEYYTKTMSYIYAQESKFKHLKSGEKIKANYFDAYGPDDGYWGYIKLKNPNNPFAKANPLVTLNDTVVSGISIPVGKGKLILYATPALFANITLKSEQVLEFAEAMLQEADFGSQIFVDIISRNTRNRPGSSGFGGSPLAYILSQQALRWAWYVLLIVALVFVLSSARRLQRIIPIQPVLGNSSIAYAETLGTLDMKYGEPNRQAERIFKQFKRRMKDRLRLSEETPDEVFMKTLARLRPEIKDSVDKAYALWYIHANQPEHFNDSRLVAFFNYLTKIQNAL